MQFIGKLNKEKLGIYKNLIVTEDVIITEERIKHIKEHHPGDYETYNKYLSIIIKNPDYIINDNKNINTILLLKSIYNNKGNIQIVLKLNTNIQEIDKKNSILTLWKVKTKTYKQIIRNKEIIWKKLDKNE